MYAVIETGGKQYRVELGSQLAVERLSVEAGETIRFERVLLVADGDNAQVGTPLVSEALVTAEVVSHDRGDKLVVFKYRPKARRRVKKGHRQPQTIVRVADIQLDGRSAAAEASRKEEAERKTRKKEAAEAERQAAADRALADKLAAEAKAAEEEEAKAAEEEEAKAAADSKSGPATTRKKAVKAAAEKKSTSKTAAEEDEGSAPPKQKRKTAAKADATAAEATEETGRRTRRAAPKKDE